MIPARLLEFESDPPLEPAMDELAQLPGQFATLKVDVEYIKRDVSDIKVALKGVHETLGTLDARVQQGEKGLLLSQKELTERIDSVDKRLTEKIDGVDKHLTEKIDGVDKHLAAKIDGVKLWVVGSHFTLAASLLFVLAKAFKWI